MSGWRIPVKDTNYPLSSDTFYFTTESATGGSDKVDFLLYTEYSSYITSFWWRFKDWGYVINLCTPDDYSLKFPVTPPTGVKKTWEVTITPEDVKIKCNTLQVLHFIFNNTYDNYCNTQVKGKIAAKVHFSHVDSATKLFTTELLGKQSDACINYFTAYIM